MDVPDGVEAGSPAAERPRRRPLVVRCSLVAACLTVVAVHEARTSHGQAEIFARISSAMGYDLGEGPSDQIRFPSGGPFDVRAGYDRIPLWIQRLDSSGYDVTHQVRLTRSMARWVDRGLYPIYREKEQVGLRIEARNGRVLFDERFPRYTYADFDSIPELLWRTLVYIETQGMLDDRAPRRNPAIEWDRLASSAAKLALRELGAGRPMPGGSTLATQIEKFRHSPGGITRTPRDKLRQMLTASLRAYSHGPNTYEHRRRVVREYLNSVPLAGQVGHGEVVGLGEGLWAWFGTPFDEANEILRREPADAVQRIERARIYRQALSLFVAQRRPSGYLTRPERHSALASLTEVYLRLLERDGVIPRELAHDARRVGAPMILANAPRGGQTSASGLHKGPSSVRSHALALTRAGGAYELDRLDLTVRSTLDHAWDSVANALLNELEDPAFLEANGFRQQGLLAVGEPSRVVYSLLLLERTESGNLVRLQADNYRGDLRLADGSRLELGSTAKLRALVTYLEVMEELHTRLAGLNLDSLKALEDAPRDALTRWVASHLAARPEASLGDVLDAAMRRIYSASPDERFFTGGANLTFSNFDGRFDGHVMTVADAFRNSVNLPFIRIMRDIVDYEVTQLGTNALLAMGDSAWRREYLVRFAGHEGAQFVRRFHRRYRDRSGHDVFDALLEDRRLSPAQLAWAVRSVAPDVPVSTFGALIRSYGPDAAISDARVVELHAAAEPSTLTLSDLGYLSRIHPIELWVASQKIHRPGVTLEELITDSRHVTVDVYGWLLRTTRTRAQDARIRSVLEIEAFQRIHARWRRLGYPFDDLTPSLGTAIGSSGDRPSALAELAGLIVNDGVMLPVVRVEELRFGEGTPFETRLARGRSGGERRLSREVATVLEASLYDVVESGTGRRARDAMLGADGEPLRIGGKTGTGDNRHRVYDGLGRHSGTVVMNRTATFVFIAGDRYFGVVTAHVQGREAEGHGFTSALPAQVLKVLGERLEEPVQAPADQPLGGLRGPTPEVVTAADSDDGVELARWVW